MRNHTQNPRLPEKAVGHKGAISNRTHSAKEIDQQSIRKSETLSKQKLQSVFNLVKSVKGKQAIICTALTGEQATSLVTALGKELNSPLLIKFAGIEVAK